MADLVAAWERAKAAGDGEAMAAAALALAANPTFGGVAGGVPALLFEARSRTPGAARTRLTAALARAWVYAGHPARAAGFAAEAHADAERQCDPTLLADALDAQLAVHWGPDQLADRLRFTARLEETAAHLADVEARLSAHLWRLSTALEVLENAAVRRQLRALDVLAAESGSARVAFFAASRRGMHALLTGDLDAARAASADAVAAGRAAGAADVEAVEHALGSGIARQAGDAAALAAEARGWEDYGLAEGIRSIAAWAAVFWAEVGEPERARAVLDQLDDFAAIPHDVDWLLTVYLLTEVAAAVGEPAQAEAGIDLLTPYAGRGVIDAGGVAFAGVVDAALARASGALDRPDDAARWSASAAAAYRRLGATWLLDTLAVPRARRTSPPSGSGLGAGQPAQLGSGASSGPGSGTHGRPGSVSPGALGGGTHGPFGGEEPTGPGGTTPSESDGGAPGKLGAGARSGPGGGQPIGPGSRQPGGTGSSGDSGPSSGAHDRRDDGAHRGARGGAGDGAPGGLGGGTQGQFGGEERAGPGDRTPDRPGGTVLSGAGGGVEPRVLHFRPGVGGIWWVGRDGEPSAVREVRGLRYLHLLLSRPGVDVPALELSDAVAGNAARAVDGDAGPLLDRQALAAYRRRLGELDDELVEAREHADLAREERLDREREALLDQLRTATGLGGRARVAGGAHERARVAVRKAIAAAIDRVAALDPSLGRLLGDTVTTGATCRYDPDPDRPVRWVL